MTRQVNNDTPGSDPESPTSASELLSKYVERTKLHSETFWASLKRWFIAASIVGAVTGLLVTAFEWVASASWRVLSSNINLVTVVALPTAGLALSGLALQYLTSNPNVNGTEEYIDAYHSRTGRASLRSFPGKLLASFATLAFGGSAGMEGPSIYIGSVIGSLSGRRLWRLGFTPDDVRHLVVAGAAAGISAVFKAPLTGIVFALEVPYRGDFARQALVPSLVSSVTAYLVMVQFVGVEPLFKVPDRLALDPEHLLVALLLGLAIGVAARLFAASYHTFKRWMRRMPGPLWAKTTAGGFVTGMFGLASLVALGTPAALSTGYANVDALLTGAIGPGDALVLFVLKGGATLATLASGAAGGIFIPMIVLGASLGTFAGDVLPGAGGPLFTVVGMASFLAAGYSTPLAAAVFVAETTGGAGYLIPGLIAAAVAYSVSGPVSVSDGQTWRRETSMDRLLRVRVADVMTHDVVTVEAGQSVEQFIEADLLRHRYKSMPVTNGLHRLVGMISITDVRTVPKEERARTRVGDVAVTDLLTARPSDPVGAVVAEMVRRDVDRVPVVGEDDPTSIVGIVSSTDVLNLERVLSCDDTTS